MGGQRCDTKAGLEVAPPEVVASRALLSCRHPTDYSGQIGITLCFGFDDTNLSKSLLFITSRCDHKNGPGGQGADRGSQALKHECSGQQVGFQLVSFLAQF